MTALRGLQERVGVISRRVSRDPRAREVQEVLKAFGDAGGSLLAAGLAFNALFALVPALLAVVGLVGFAIGDPARAQEIIQSLVERVGAIRDLIEALLRNLLEQRDALSIVGLIGFLWGASGFYGSLDEAMRRLFPGGLPRGPVEQRLRGVVAVLALVGAALAAVLVTSVLSVLEGIVGLPGYLADARVLTTIVTVPIFVLVVWLAYIIVPVAGPGPRIALPPAIVAGVLMAVLTALFSALTQVLVGRVAGIGLLGAVFSALVWLRLIFEVLIYGGAWARVRRDHARLRRERPTLGSLT